MPKVNWGVSAADVDDFDPDKYKPYDGPIPPNGVYNFRVKFARFIAPTRDKLPQLRAGLELVPRKNRKDEKQFAGFFMMAYMTVSERTQGFYVPFLNAIGVKGRDFEQRTVADEEGNIQKIGAWRNTGDTLIKAEIKDEPDQHGVLKKRPGWMGPVGELTEAEEDEAEEFDAAEYDDEEVGDDDDWLEDDE